MVGTLRFARLTTPRNDEITTTGGTMTTETKIDTGTDELLCVIRDRVAIITLNRPEARNCDVGRSDAGAAQHDQDLRRESRCRRAVADRRRHGVLRRRQRQGHGGEPRQDEARNVPRRAGRRSAGATASADRRAGLGAQADHCRPARPRGRRRSRSGDGLRHPHRRAIGIPFHRLSQGGPERRLWHRLAADAAGRHIARTGIDVHVRQGRCGQMRGDRPGEPRGPRRQTAGGSLRARQSRSPKDRPSRSAT